MCKLLYQDFNEQFEGYTQQRIVDYLALTGCFIRISMSNLKDIHNHMYEGNSDSELLYQDFNEQFEGYTQPELCIPTIKYCCFIRISMSNLKDIHNSGNALISIGKLLYQDFNEQFEGYTQRVLLLYCYIISCFIRISMSNLKDIHNAFCQCF